jgi:hypothetical protein
MLRQIINRPRTLADTTCSTALATLDIDLNHAKIIISSDPQCRPDIKPALSSWSRSPPSDRIKLRISRPRGTTKLVAPYEGWKQPCFYLRGREMARGVYADMPAMRLCPEGINVQ